MKHRILYRDSGVDIDRADEAKRRIKELLKKSKLESLFGGIGKFAGFFPLNLSQFKEPVLVSSVDGVGTKLKVAFMAGIHNTVGKDLVNHCINDILTHGAFPLFFMDYISTGKMNPDVVEEIVKGIVEACKESGVYLIGGETAEMPGFYEGGEYDLAGFIVGIAEKNKIIDGSRIEEGNIIFGLPSSGLHTNGYSLARKILFEKNKFDINQEIKELNGSIKEILLKVHRNYLRVLRFSVEKNLLRGLSHITGGGFIGNIPRILPEEHYAEINLNSWKIPPIFKYLIKEANLNLEESFRTFNMGIGMIGISNEGEAEKIFSHFESINEKYFIIGKIKKGKKGVKFIE
ncbi:MAG: phosphoribosylformylglycinamidine cyclo-ligase [Acidobacteriota bacterium]